MPWGISLRRLLVVCLAAAIPTLPRPAVAQTMTDVLSFLLINRSIATDDFVRDTAAAASTRDAISTFLLSELGTLPVSSSSSGFTYRVEPSLGTTLRSSDSFGPFFTERSLTAGARQIAIGLGFRQARYNTIDGRNLRDGTLVATASQLVNEAEPFDTETLTLDLHTSTMTFHANVGVTDRLDVGAALPFIRLHLDGERVDTYRGRRSVQAVATGTSSGLGDVILRTKYNLLRRTGGGIAVAAEGRLPTGDERNLLGSGNTTFAPQAIASIERGRAAVHGTAGYTFGGFSGEANLSAAGTYVATQRLTIVGELAARRVASVGRLRQTAAPHPTLVNVRTLRLSTTDEATTRALMLAGFKWNLASTWLLTVHVLRPLTETGLNGGWTPTIAIDRAFVR